jgi:hypothetical protein
MVTNSSGSRAISVIDLVKRHEALVTIVTTREGGDDIDLCS